MIWIIIAAIIIFVVVIWLLSFKQSKPSQGVGVSGKMPQIRTPIEHRYYLLYYKSDKLVVRFVNKACWTYSFKIVGEDFSDRVDGELILPRGASVAFVN